MTQDKITPVLWFHTQDGKIKHITDYYALIFENNFTADSPIPLGETPSAYSEMCNVKFFGNKYLLMTTAIEHHTFNDTFFIMIHCKDQEALIQAAVPTKPSQQSFPSANR